MFADLDAEGHLRGLALDDLAPRLAHYLGEVNAAHPFREGNGRTQRAFFRQLARDAGWSFRWSTLTADENTAASGASLHGDNSMLESLLRNALTPITP